jgi:hypothetical protein
LANFLTFFLLSYPLITKDYFADWISQGQNPGRLQKEKNSPGAILLALSARFFS